MISHTRASSYNEVPSQDEVSRPDAESGRTLSTSSDNQTLFSKVNTSYDGAPKDVDTIINIAETGGSMTRASRHRRRRYQGWRFGVSLSASTAFTILLTNLVLTIYGALYADTNSGIGTAYQGDGNCTTIGHLSLWLHVAINALSSILLSASNYTMQCLSSPTRTEVDRAHAKGDWLDIGVPGIRNLRRISWSRLGLWWILAVSSVPIHLLYNSAIFKTIDSNAYTAVVANTGFFERGANANYSLDMVAVPDTPHKFNASEDGGNITIWWDAVQEVQNIFALDSAYRNTTIFQNLSNEDCISRYEDGFLSGRDHVIAVTSDQGNSTNETLFWFYQSGMGSFQSGPYLPANGWICYDANSYNNLGWECDTAGAKKNATNWTIAGKKIDYCLSRKQETHCKLNFSVQVMTAVIVCNALKVGVMLFTLWTQKDDTLVTIGDAIASFLDYPDEYTKGRCMMTKKDAFKGPLQWKPRKSTEAPMPRPLPVTYHEHKVLRWFSAVSVRRWIVTVGLGVALLGAAGGLFAMGATFVTSSVDHSVFDLGFGRVDSRLLFNAGWVYGASGLLSSVIEANLPQAVLSFWYVMYNGVFTCMCLSHEWSRYAARRLPLRVTTPRGQQRSSFYLQIPYTYSLPLLVVCGVLHWLVSQSLFLVRVDMYKNGELRFENGIAQLGYSLTPLVVIIILASSMVIVVLANGFRKFKGDIPVAGSCSVAISAACHPPKRDVDAAVLPVKWGDVRGGTDEVGHCCLTSEDVQDLIPGRMYAGEAVSSGADRSDGVRLRSIPS